jgi:Holliday junction resolvasome RuvABC endonuclease subunit
MDNYYLGLDCSSKAIHGVIIDDMGKLCGIHKWVSKLPTFDERFPVFLRNFCDDLGIIKNTFPNIQVAIEAPIFIQNPKTTMQIAAVVYTAQFICSWWDVEYASVQNKSWKKYALEKGNASKQEIFGFANIFWKDAFKEQDHADAACIALWGRFNYLGEDI